MKAIVSRLCTIALCATLLASCSEQRVVPIPRPSPTPAPLPPPPPRPIVDWQHAPVTPGDWVWSNAGGRSQASFAGGLMQLVCDRGNNTVVVLRRGNADGAVPMTIATSAMTRTVSASGSAGGIALSLAARDPLLDAMAFSRGHFALEVAGLGAIYVPSWPEVSRVIEDCR